MQLVLASIIAAGGVIGDATPAVIGAMIIAPLGTPIYGLALAAVIGDRRALRSSLKLLVGGIAVNILIGVIIGLITVNRMPIDVNPQIVGRTAPAVLDLTVAIAVGIAGSFALARRDVADILAGVAIAISLVPGARGRRHHAGLRSLQPRGRGVRPVPHQRGRDPHRRRHRLHEPPATRARRRTATSARGAAPGMAIIILVVLLLIPLGASSRRSCSTSSGRRTPRPPPRSGWRGAPGCSNGRAVRQRAGAHGEATTAAGRRSQGGDPRGDPGLGPGDPDRGHGPGAGARQPPRVIMTGPGQLPLCR